MTTLHVDSAGNLAQPIGGTANAGSIAGPVSVRGHEGAVLIPGVAGEPEYQQIGAGESVVGTVTAGEPGCVLIHSNASSNGVTERLRLADGTVIATGGGATEPPPWWEFFADYFAGFPWWLVALVIVLRGAFRRSLANPRGLSAEARIAEYKAANRSIAGQFCGQCNHRHGGVRCAAPEQGLFGVIRLDSCDCMDFKPLPAPPERLASHPEADHCEDCGRRKPQGASCVACRLPVLAGVRV